MTQVVSYRRENQSGFIVGIIEINSPPVNALSIHVRKGIMQCLDEFERDQDAQIAILLCHGRTFIAGADITEFDKPREDPWLPEVIHRMEALEKLLVAAIHGTALGGGLETAMGCHYRFALDSALVGLPEVTLGLLPGATGTQRLTRLVGPERALDIMVSGKPIKAVDALSDGIIDKIGSGDLLQGAIDYCKELINGEAKPRRIKDLYVDDTLFSRDMFTEYRSKISSRTRGFFAPEKIIQCVEAATLRYHEGVEIENKLFQECMASEQSVSQRHMFFAERACTKVPGLDAGIKPLEIVKVGVVGGGTMGGGIAMNFANAGIPTILKEIDQPSLEKGLDIIERNYQNTVSKGRLSKEQKSKCMSMITGTTSYSDLADCDLIVEAVFENLELKKTIFSELDSIAKASCILASNTSTLDIDEIAGSTHRPENVMGWHFFAPANVMTLLELVRGKKTSDSVIVTAMSLAKKIKKTPVLVGVCFGFVGNRMFFPYVREAQQMILEGVSPERIDKVAFEWGMAMGPNGVCDLSGLDVLQKVKTEWKSRPEDPSLWILIDRLVDLGRLGQKTGSGIFKYVGRAPVLEDEVLEIAKEEAEKFSIIKRDIDDNEIIERLLYSMINEGAHILGEGIASKASDIDVVFVHGYGMGRYRGGPMHFANSKGIDNVIKTIQKYQKRYGDKYWKPAPLILELYEKNGKFA
ncbi:MAG: 3-hydroxyacyl-CoA dehydrogenase NAD-binding domain-containing protein [Pseudomonadota bacterium]|nr:3-hydroxyacyl-CoA dehydrogenase NAD-binding domain-containing protein [Pseudomonadota bacterium]